MVEGCFADWRPTWIVGILLENVLRDRVKLHWEMQELIPLPFSPCLRLPAPVLLSLSAAVFFSLQNWSLINQIFFKFLLCESIDEVWALNLNETQICESLIQDYDTIMGFLSCTRNNLKVSLKFAGFWRYSIKLTQGLTDPRVQTQMGWWRGSWVNLFIRRIVKLKGHWRHTHLRWEDINLFVLIWRWYDVM